VLDAILLDGSYFISRCGRHFFLTGGATMAEAKKETGFNGWFLIAVGVFIFLLADHRKPLLPDYWYCGMGAGKVVVYPGYTGPHAWSVNAGCEAYNPRCATETEYAHIPSRSVCVHGSLWQAITSQMAPKQQVHG
jgi:hypothetical protein